eukprot:1194608-Rhodomonas_salina.1
MSGVPAPLRHEKQLGLAVVTPAVSISERQSNRQRSNGRARSADVFVDGTATGLGGADLAWAEARQVLELVGGARGRQHLLGGGNACGARNGDSSGRQYAFCGTKRASTGMRPSVCRTSVAAIRDGQVLRLGMGV